MSKNVIVFGPTGNIASVAARTAQEHGAKVWLAMRDTSKVIPGLSAEDEKSGGYERIQADLTQPETVSAAIKKSGAEHAFAYAAHGSQDHMRGTFEAMKSSGVKLVVFLSSFTIADQDIRTIPQDEVIPYLHAQVEIQLEEVYGKGKFVAIRPGGFATNSLRWKKGIQAGKLKLYGTKFEMDCITPGDMGRVSGTILAEGPRDGQTIVYLYGPKAITQEEAAKLVAKALGKDLEVHRVMAAEAPEALKEEGVPPFIIPYFIKRLGDDMADTTPKARYEEGVENVKKYTGRPAEGFEEWVQENKSLFLD